MSTRTSLALAVTGTTVMHLYREMHDEACHLEIKMDQTNILINAVIPEPLVAGVTAIVTRAEEAA